MSDNNGYIHTYTYNVRSTVDQVHMGDIPHKDTGHSTD